MKKTKKLLESDELNSGLKLKTGVISQITGFEGILVILKLFKVIFVTRIF